MTIQPTPSTLSLTQFEILPLLCPTALTAISTKDSYLAEVQVSLPSSASGPAKVTVQDTQGTPIPAMSVTLQPGDVQGYVFNDRIMKAGIGVQSDTATAVSIFVRWKQ